ncbi:hypothetical protein RYH80_18730 [Halobaculum sp. MBLA0147]|uniref:hypothetical protein n=1 Tax=Halobaculum sp. MBLA0147 TaxID=3079934 RepID=UPI0035237B4C
MSQQEHPEQEPTSGETSSDSTPSTVESDQPADSPPPAGEPKPADTASDTTSDDESSSLLSRLRSRFSRDSTDQSTNSESAPPLGEDPSADRYQRPDFSSGFAGLREKWNHWRGGDGSLTDSAGYDFTGQTAGDAFLAPDSLAPGTKTVEIADDTVTRTLIVTGYQRNPPKFSLNGAITDSSLDFDATIKLRPYSTSDAETYLARKESQFDDRVNGALSGANDNPEADRREQEAIQHLKQQVGHGGTQTLYDVAIVITLYADSHSELDTAEDRLRTHLEDQAGMTLEGPPGTQLAGLRDSAPLGFEETIHRTNQRTQPMGSNAAASLFPFMNDSIFEEEGVLMGTNATYDTPIFLDIQNRNKGGHILRAGDIGAGKSVGAGVLDLRTAINYDNFDIAVIDPLGEFDGVNAALGGEHITIMGDEKFNPFRITKLPDHIIEATEDVIAPFEKKLTDVVTFYKRAFQLIGGSETTLNELHYGLLTYTVREAYNRKGITKDPRTHGNESPTVQFHREEVIQDIIENPEDYAETAIDVEVDKVRELARDLSVAMMPFESRYKNLYGRSEMEVDLSEGVYLDLRHLEAGSTEMGLMLHLTLSQIYEEAKATNNWVRITVDEVHKLFDNVEAAAFFEELTRHGRHFDISLQFITQTFEEFIQYDSSADEMSAPEVIQKQCGVKCFHPMDNPDEDVAREHFNLTSEQVEVIRQLERGESATNYAEYLLQVQDKGVHRIRHTPTKDELAVLDWNQGTDWTEDDVTEPESIRIRRLLDQYNQSTAPQVEDFDELDDQLRDQIVSRARNEASVLAEADPDVLLELLEDITVGDLVDALPDSDQESTDNSQSPPTAAVDTPSAEAVATNGASDRSPTPPSDDQPGSDNSPSRSTSVAAALKQQVEEVRAASSKPVDQSSDTEDTETGTMAIRNLISKELQDDEESTAPESDTAEAIEDTQAPAEADDADPQVNTDRSTTPQSPYDHPVAEEFSRDDIEYLLDQNKQTLKTMLSGEGGTATGNSIETKEEMVIEILKAQANDE